MPTTPIVETPLRHIKAVVHAALGHGRAVFGAEARYGIFAGYRHRAANAFFDDTQNKDEWQREVYAYAKRLMTESGLRRVADVGCGSAFKLLDQLGAFETIGYDLPSTVAFLKQTYPDRLWRSAPLSARDEPRADLVICSDVIEHVADPDQLLDFIDSIATHDIIISTPERSLLYPSATSRYRYGPPSNPSHVREWDAAELARYLGRRFDIVHHAITNHAQATQMVHCVRRG